jgi:hypothetical protein
MLRASLHVADGPADLGPTRRTVVGDLRIDAFPNLVVVRVVEVESA